MEKKRRNTAIVLIMAKKLPVELKIEDTKY